MTLELIVMLVVALFGGEKFRPLDLLLKFLGVKKDGPINPKDILKPIRDYLAAREKDQKSKEDEKVLEQIVAAIKPEAK